MNAACTIASPHPAAIAFCALAAWCLSACGIGSTCLASEPIRVQILWSAGSPTAWQGSIASDGASLSNFRSLGVSPDEANVFRVEDRRIEAIPAVERRSDGCEFSVDAEAVLNVELAPAGATGDEPLTMEVAVADLFEHPDGVAVDAGERSLTIRRAPQDRLRVEPSAPKETYGVSEEIAFVSRHRIEKATAVPLDWKASLISLRDGAVVWTEERSTDPLAEGAESRLEWDVPLSETEGAYRLAVEAYPRKFGSRWYRGKAVVGGSYDLVALAGTPPVAASAGEPALVIRPGERSWRDRVGSVSPVRWLGFSADGSPGDEGIARGEQGGDRSWLVLDPGAVRGFPLPPNPARKGLAVEIEVAAGEPGTVEVACCRGVPGAAGEAFEASAVAWRTALVIPDLPAPSPTASPVETLRVLLPIAAEEGTLLVRAADDKRPLRLAQIRIVDETPISASTSDRELASSPRTRTATLVVEDMNWPSRLSDGIAPPGLSPRRSMRLKWYEASLRLARYAKAEGYDRVCLPAIAEGGALFSLSEISPRLIEVEHVEPAEIGPPVDALEILLSVFDREGISVTLAYSPTDEEAFDAGAMLRRWEELIARGAGHSSFQGCLLRLPESRFDARATARRATAEDLRQFERALGVTLPTDAALRQMFLSRNGALWREWQATQAADDLEELRLAAAARKVACFVEVGSDANRSDGEEPPAALSVLEQSGWSLWRRGDFQPTGPVAIATQPVRFAKPLSASDTAPPELWLRRGSGGPAADASFASRVDALSERRLLIEFVLRDAAGSVESDRVFAPTFDPELARLRRTISSLPPKPLRPAARRTPLGDEPLRVRAMRDEQGLYVAAINLAPWPVRAAVEFGAGEVGTMRSLGGGSVAPPTASAGAIVWTVDLAPLGIAAVRFEGGVADVADWKTIEPPPPGIELATIRAAIDDLSRRLSAASDPSLRPALFRDAFEEAALERFGWRVDRSESANANVETPARSDGGTVRLSPSGGTLRLTTPSLATPATRTATVSIVARVPASPASSAASVVRLVALSGAPSVATHVSARVDLAASSESGRSPDASERRQIYVPIENMPEAFWQDWTVTLVVAGEGTLLVDEFAILDGYPSPERLSAWRKQLAIAEYALREKRMFAAYEAVNSPSMRLVRGSFASEKRQVASATPLAVTPDAPTIQPPPSAKPADDRGMWERLWNWAPEPVFR
ncbi:MAG TPA: hypothetical protein VGN57_09165 [Pirellulaceae bacterium]|jgi:hypothetical protein|nr:hypothetical protein [Pirellulaceae bacterium]